MQRWRTEMPAFEVGNKLKTQQNQNHKQQHLDQPIESRIRGGVTRQWQRIRGRDAAIGGAKKREKRGENRGERKENLLKLQEEEEWDLTSAPSSIAMILPIERRRRWDLDSLKIRVYDIRGWRWWRRSSRSRSSRCSVIVNVSVNLNLLLVPPFLELVIRRTRHGERREKERAWRRSFNGGKLRNNLDLILMFNSDLSQVKSDAIS